MGRACNDPRHETPCDYDACAECQRDCDPPEESQFEANKDAALDRWTKMGAPLSALAALAVASNPEEFDEIKAMLKGEV